MGAGGIAPTSEEIPIGRGGSKMAEFVERSVRAEVGSDLKVEAPLSKIHPRQLVHAGITALLMVLYLVVGPVFFNTVEPRVLGIPFYVFWTVFLLPALNFVNLILFARSMMKHEQELKGLNLEPWR
jgi:hypothetical protein